MGSFISIKAQEPWVKRLYFETNYHYGFLLPHSEFIKYFVEKHIQGFQVNVGLMANGEKAWHQSYNFPRLGIGYQRSGLGNDKIYGHFDAVFAYVDRYYLNWQNRFNIGNRLSFGGAYVSKKFDLEKNGTNLAIGTNINAYVNYSIESLIQVSPNIEFKLGAGITHISNGNFKQPNKGLNSFTAFSGITYSINKPKYLKVNSEKNDSSKHQFLVMACYGRKQISRKYDYNYSVIGLSGEYSHIIVGNSWGGAALTVYHDPSLTKELALNDTINAGYSDKIRITFNLVYELKMGKVSYVFQPGIYLKNSFKKNGSISNRIAVRYQINENWNAGLTIKAHWFAIADFFEWGIGYNWEK